MALEQNNGRRKPHTRKSDQPAGAGAPHQSAEERAAQSGSGAGKTGERVAQSGSGAGKPGERAAQSGSGAGKPGERAAQSGNGAGKFARSGDNVRVGLGAKAETGSRTRSRLSDAGMPAHGSENTAGGRNQQRNAARAQTEGEARQQAAGLELKLPPMSEGARSQSAGRTRNVRRLNAAGEAEAELQQKRQDQKERKRTKKRYIVLAVLLELLTLGLIVSYGFYVRVSSLSRPISFDAAAVKNDNIDISKREAMQGFWTLAIFGVDSRDSSVGSGVNADVQIIANIDMGSGAVKLVSVYRDTYLNISKRNSYAKINQAYCEGGPEQAVMALNRNLDLDMENYITFSWKTVADAIEVLGGVDVEITKREFAYMNAYIHENCIETGISRENPAAMYLKGPGMQHLNGIQALAYMRQRKMDTDFVRTERQRRVIEQTLQNAKKTDLATLLRLIDEIMPQVATNVDAADLIQLAKSITKFHIDSSMGFPSKLTTQMMGGKGDCVLPLNLKSNVTELHRFLFNDENYDPSSAVQRFSEKIAEDAATYKNGGGRKASSDNEDKSDKNREESRSTERSGRDEDESTSGTEKHSAASESSRSSSQDGPGVSSRASEENGTSAAHPSQSGSTIIRPVESGTAAGSKESSTASGGNAVGPGENTQPSQNTPAGGDASSGDSNLPTGGTQTVPTAAAPGAATKPTQNVPAVQAETSKPQSTLPTEAAKPQRAVPAGPGVAAQTDGGSATAPALGN